MATREGTSLRRSLTSLAPPKRIRALASELGVVQRRRKIDIVALVYALALGFSVGARRSLTGLRRAYERATGTTLAPSAFYDRFTHGLTRLLEQLVSEALGKLGRAKPRLAGAFQAFHDVLVTDSTILRLHNALEHCPARGIIGTVARRAWWRAGGAASGASNRSGTCSGTAP